MKKLLIVTLFVVVLFNGCSSPNLFGTTTITGRIIVKGQAPNTFIALKIRNRVYINVVGDLKRVLSASYQGKKVVLRGKYLSQAVGVAQPARFEATKVVSILER